jgi:hypothetical protein
VDIGCFDVALLQMMTEYMDGQPIAQVRNAPLLPCTTKPGFMDAFCHHRPSLSEGYARQTRYVRFEISDSTWEHPDRKLRFSISSASSASPAHTSSSSSFAPADAQLLHSSLRDGQTARHCMSRCYQEVRIDKATYNFFYQLCKNRFQRRTP